MKRYPEIIPLNKEELISINGGGFAYDLGRALRFLVQSGGGAMIPQAIADWTYNEAVNEAVNGV